MASRPSWLPHLNTTTDQNSAAAGIAGTWSSAQAALLANNKSAGNLTVQTSQHLLNPHFMSSKIPEV